MELPVPPSGICTWNPPVGFVAEMRSALLTASLPVTALTVVMKRSTSARNTSMVFEPFDPPVAPPELQHGEEPAGFTSVAIVPLASTPVTPPIVFPSKVAPTVALVIFDAATTVCQ